MNKAQFLNAESVQSFIKWIAPKLDKSGGFKHAYIMKRPNGVLWECDSIYSAFENYKWAFTCKHPVSSKSLKGETFEECRELLGELASGLRNSVVENDVQTCQEYCFSILDWGGVLGTETRGNKKYVINKGESITSYLKDCNDRLNSDSFDTKGNYKDIIMTAGFTKIYSLLIVDFVIYDGRVGAALGLLVRTFCEETGLKSIPQELLFAFGNAKGDPYGIENRRNPSKNIFKFPQLTQNTKHTENNVRANWLLEEIINKSESSFNLIDSSIRLRALESALFMIGYDVKQKIF